MNAYKELVEKGTGLPLSSTRLPPEVQQVQATFNSDTERVIPPARDLWDALGLLQGRESPREHVEEEEVTTPEEEDEEEGDEEPPEDLDAQDYTKFAMMMALHKTGYLPKAQIPLMVRGDTIYFGNQVIPRHMASKCELFRMVISQLGPLTDAQSTVEILEQLFEMGFEEAMNYPYRGHP